MAGYLRQDEVSGEVYSVPYEYPFVVRGTPKKMGWFDRPEDVTVASFRTEEEAKTFLSSWEKEYKKGPDGFARLHIENWNEDEVHEKD